MISKRQKIRIATKRLILREFEPGDASHLYHLNSDPQVLKYTGDRPFTSLQEATSFLENYRDYELNGYGRWAVELKENGQFLGWCGLKKHDDAFVDLGFRLLRKYWNQGYATEAARASVNFAFRVMCLEQLIGRAAVENTASLRVLENIGMRFWKWGSFEGVPFASLYRITGEEYSQTMQK